MSGGSPVHGPTTVITRVVPVLGNVNPLTSMMNDGFLGMLRYPPEPMLIVTALAPAPCSRTPFVSVIPLVHVHVPAGTATVSPSAAALTAVWTALCAQLVALIVAP